MNRFAVSQADYMLDQWAEQGLLYMDTPEMRLTTPLVEPSGALIKHRLLLPTARGRRQTSLSTSDCSEKCLFVFVQVSR